MSGTRDDNEQLDCECYADSRTKKTCPPTRNVTHPLVHTFTSVALVRTVPRYYEFTQEEMKALEECDTESFYQRCLPFSTILATLTYAGIKNGTLRINPHFGVLPKVMVAVSVGYCLGRLSYLSHCDSKLRKLPPNSHLGNTMRKYYDDNIAYNTPKTPPKK